MSSGKMKGAVAYARAMAGGEVASQLAAIERFARESNFEIRKVFMDAADDERSGLEDALSHVTSGPDKTLIIWRLDRIDSRFSDLKGFISFLSELAANEATLVSVSDRLDSSGSAPAFILNVGPAIKRFKSSLQGERVHRSLAAAKAEGRRVGRPKQRNDEEIRKLRTEGYSIRQIASKVGLSTWAVHSALKN